MAAIETNPPLHSEVPAEVAVTAANEPEKVRLLSRIQKYSLVHGTRAVVQTVPGTSWATGIVSLVYEPLRNSFLLRYAMDTSDMILVGLLDQCDGLRYVVYDNDGGRFFAGPADLVFGGINRGVESFVSNHWPQTKFPENYNGEFAKLMMLLRTILHRDYAVEPANNQVADN